MKASTSGELARIREIFFEDQAEASKKINTSSLLLPRRRFELRTIVSDKREKGHHPLKRVVVFAFYRLSKACICMTLNRQGNFRLLHIPLKNPNLHPPEPLLYWDEIHR